MKLYIIGVIGILLILFSGCGTYGRKSSITNPNVLAEEMRQKSPSASQGNQQKSIERKENPEADPATNATSK
jgi:hypothetical protein